MAKRKITPDIETFKQWRREGTKEMERHFRDRPAGHPTLIMALARAYVDGYIRGRVHQWRLEQELAVFRESLDKPTD